MPAARPSDRAGARRRQRSVRVTVAVALMGMATVLVAATLAVSSPLLSVPGGVLVVALGWAAVRMMWTEVLESRREHAAERARLARDYRVVVEQACEEHAEFRATMTDRLASAHMTMREQEHQLVVQGRQLVVSERRAGLAESKLLESSRRLDRVQARVHDLESALSLRQDEETDALAQWEGVSATGEDPVVTDLSDWGARVRRRA